MITPFLESPFQTIAATQIAMGFAFAVMLFVVGWLLLTIGKRRYFLQDLPLMLLILLVGLLLRAVWIGWTQPEPLSDFRIYWDYAQQFYHGNWSFDVPVRHPGSILLFTDVFFLTGPTLWSIWGSNLVLATLMMLLVFSISEKLWGRGVAFVAMAIAALEPQLISYSALVATEYPAAVFSLAVFWAILQLRESSLGRSMLSWVGLGILLYGTILVRSTNLLYLALLPLMFLLVKRPEGYLFWFKRYLVMTLTTGILLGTWVYHQYLIGGAPRLFWGDGLWLSCAVQYDRDGRYTDIRDTAYYAQVKPFQEKFAKTGATKDEIALYEAVGREAMKVVQRDPMRYIQEGFKTRLRHLVWTSSQTGIAWSVKGSSLLRSHPPKLIKRLSTISNIFWQVLVCLTVAGLPVLLFKTLRHAAPLVKDGVFLMLGYTLAWMLFYALVAYSAERYTFQIIPFGVMLSAYTVGWVWSLLGQIRPAKGRKTRLATS